MSKLTDVEAQNILETFNLFDDRGDGQIKKGCFGDVVRALGLNPSESDIHKVTKEMSSERMSFEEFLPCYDTLAKRAKQYPIMADDFVEGLRVFDREGNGLISSAELRHVLTTLGERLTDEEVEVLLAGHDDKNGNIQYEDWIYAMMAGR